MSTATLVAAAMAVLCLGSTVSIGFRGATVLPWHVLIFPLTFVLRRFDWRHAPLPVVGALLAYASAGLVSATIAMSAGADPRPVIRELMMLLMNVVLICLGVGCPSTWLPRLRWGLFVGLALALAGGCLEALGAHRFQGSLDILGSGADMAPASMRLWAESAPAFGFGNPNNYAATQVTFACLVLLQGGPAMLLFLPIGFVVAKADSDLGIIAMCALASCWACLNPKRAWLLLIAVAVLLLWLTYNTATPDDSPVRAVTEKVELMSNKVGEVLSGNDPRTQLLVASWQAWLAHPLLGSGPSGSRTIIPEMTVLTIVDHVTDSHNQLATAFVETGLLGGAALLTLLAYPFWALVRTPRLEAGVWGRPPSKAALGLVQTCLVLTTTFASNSSTLWPLWIMAGFTIRQSVLVPRTGMESPPA